MRHKLIAIAAALVLGGCYDRFDTPSPATEVPRASTSIADLQKKWTGSRLTVGGNVVVGGRVTSSDRAGNFYRTFTISDGTGGMEILAGPTDLYNRYPVGCYVAVDLDGCAIDCEKGVLQAGLPAADYDYGSLDYLQSDVVLGQHIFRRDDIAAIEIPQVTIAGLHRSMCGSPATIAGLRRAEAESDVWSGYVRFEDAAGNGVYTYTSSYADFADEEIPAGGLSITGIVQYASVPHEKGEFFILKMRDHEDCRTID